MKSEGVEMLAFERYEYVLVKVSFMHPDSFLTLALYYVYIVYSFTYLIIYFNFCKTIRRTDTVASQ